MMLRSAAYKNDDTCKVYINEKAIECSMNHAMIVSEKIYDAYVADSSTREFHFDYVITDKSVLLSVEKLFTNGELPKEIPEKLLDEYFNVGENLGIMLYIEPLIKNLKEQNLEVDNVFNKIHILEKYSDSQKRLDFIATNFSSIPEDDLFDYYSMKSPNDFIELLTRPYLEIKNEDQLISLSIRLSEFKEEFFEVFPYLNVDYGSKDQIVRFEELINKLSSSNLIIKYLWEFVKPKLITDNVKHFVRVFSCYYKDEPFDGIFSFLKKFYNTNTLIESEFVVSKYKDKPSPDCKNLIDYKGSLDYVIDYVKGNSIVFDFKTNQVCLSGYSIKSGNSTYNSVNFSMCGSVDGTKWEVISKQKEATILHSKTQNQTWECKKSNFFRHIMFRCDGTYSNSSYTTIALRNIELFGTIRIKDTTDTQ